MGEQDCQEDNSPGLEYSLRMARLSLFSEIERQLRVVTQTVVKLTDVLF